MSVSLKESELTTFWTNVNYNSSHLFDADDAEQHFVNFISLFPSAPHEEVKQAIKEMLSQVRPFGEEAFQFFLSQYRHYLHDPGSPYRNDTYYEPVLEYLLDSTELSQSQLDNVERDLLLVRSNPVGGMASDFQYLNTQGNKQLMSDINAGYTILLFYEPGCIHCEELIAELRTDEYLDHLIANDDLCLLAIYPFGEKGLWKSYQENIPKSWRNGFDENLTVIKKNLYDLRATPSLFFLDENKSVILRDTDLNTLKQYLKNLI